MLINKWFSFNQVIIVEAMQLILHKCLSDTFFLLSWVFCINVSLLLLLLFLLFSGPNQSLVSAGSPVGKLIFPDYLRWD